MTKMSSFKGFSSTKEAGETFIMEKAAFLLYLAHKKRVEDKKSIIKFNSCGSLIDLVFSSDKLDHEAKFKAEKATDFSSDNGVAGMILMHLETLYDMKATP